MTIFRDFKANPYTPHEQRVANYLDDIAGIGGGDDPVEFLIASHHALRRRAKIFEEQVQVREKEIVEYIQALEEIFKIVHTPTRDTKHKHANDHYSADFDKIRSIIRRTLGDDQV